MEITQNKLITSSEERKTVLMNEKKENSQQFKKNIL